MNDFNAIFQLCEAIGTAAFAVSGAMVAIDKGTDIFGVLLMAVFTALGGGTLRDVLIGHFPPRMFTNFHYVLLSCICAVTVFIIARIFKERYIERERLIEQVNNKYQNTIIIVTHNDAIKHMADQVVSLRDGQIRSQVYNDHKIPAMQLEW